MEEKVKQRIIKLRRKGLGYIKVSREVGISVNTIKFFCRINNLTVTKKIILSIVNAVVKKLSKLKVES